MVFFNKFLSGYSYTWCVCDTTKIVFSKLDFNQCVPMTVYNSLYNNN